MNSILTVIICLAIIPTNKPRTSTQRPPSEKKQDAVSAPVTGTRIANLSQIDPISEPQRVRIIGVDRDKWDWAGYAGSLLLVGVGAAGVFVGVSSLCILRKQTTALIESVAVARQTANTNAETLASFRNKERARLSLDIVSHEFGEIPQVTYKLTCHGTTPAYVVSSWESTNLFPIPDIPWPRDAHGFELRELPSVIPNGTSEGSTFIMGTDRKSTSSSAVEKAIGDGSQYLHFRVRIVYEDIFGDEHELIVNKIYGSKPELGIYDIPMGHGFPRWHDSAYQYGSEV